MQRNRLKIRLLLNICSVFLFLIIVFPGAVHSANTLGLSQHFGLAYKVYLQGILAGSFDVIIISDDRQYKIKSTSRSRGILDLMFNFRRKSEVQGKIAEQITRPSKYTAVGMWAGSDRSVHIKYQGSDILQFSAQPSAFDDGRTDVATSLLIGTKDPFSALYQAILSYNHGEKCYGNSKIFDGRRRYDFVFSAITSRDVKGPLFSGPAYVCRIQQIPIAGFSDRVWLPQLMRPKWVDIWLAKVQNDLPNLPIRLEADAGISSVVAELVAVRRQKTSAAGQSLAK